MIIQSFPSVNKLNLHFTNKITFKDVTSAPGAISNTMPSYDPTPTEDTRQITDLNFVEVELTENVYVSDVYPNVHHSTVYNSQGMGAT